MTALAADPYAVEVNSQMPAGTREQDATPIDGVFPPCRQNQESEPPPGYYWDLRAGQQLVAERLRR